MTLIVRDLVKTYGHGLTAVHAVANVDLDVPDGQVPLIMGPSGSGKTTLLLMLGALLRPTSGSIVIGTGENSVDLATAPSRTLPGLRARHIGFVFQDFNLIPALTAIENVELAANPDSASGREVARRLRGLATRDGRSVVVVSHDDRLREIADRTVWLEDGRVRGLDTLVTDPICHMKVHPGTGPHLQGDSAVVWFCSTGCRDEYATLKTYAGGLT